MKPFIALLLAAALLPHASAQTIPTKSSIPYVENGHERQVLDIYAPPGAKDLPVVFWIHGGGWVVGDKSDVRLKPQWFMDKGFVFVSTNYRLLLGVDMGTLIRDVAKSFAWVQKNIAAHGGDPKRVLIGGHSAGAQLAAILCTDERYLKEHGIAFDVLLGCVPVDGDTYDIPAMIDTAETRLRVHGFPPPTNGHRQKFGITPENHKDFSAVTHIAKGKGIPPFLVLYVNDHPDTSIQAQRLGNVLKESGVVTTLFGAKETNHSKLNDNLGLADDPATAALAEFVGKVTRK
jgi:arylformamidase